MEQKPSTSMTQFFSEKLRIVSFFSIIVVFYIHAGYPDEVNKTMTIPVIVRSCTVGVFGSCAVPMFYAISGFLFFYGIKNGIADVFKKMRKRIKTLLIPFVIAALFYPAFYVLMELIPGASAYINNGYMERFVTMPMHDIISSLFYKSEAGEPWAYHLWFMRDLIIIVALMPGVFYLRKWTNFWSVIIVFVLYVLLFPMFHFLYGMYWFVAGSFVMDKTHKLPRWSIYMMFTLFIAMAIFRNIDPDGLWKHFEILERSFGVCSIWGLYDIFVSKSFRINSAPYLSFACQFTFFLYLYHEPALHIFVKVIPIVLGENEFGYTMSFLLSPLIFAPICITAGYLLKKFTPLLYNVIVGGR